jgi:UDP-glucuronate 4-epimerase
MKVLVTGASGFIGRNVLLALPRDWQVVATWHRDASFPEMLRRQDLGHVHAVRVDLGDPGAVAEVSLGTFDACVYLAANGDPAHSVQAPLEDLRANAGSVINVLSAASFGHFLYLSSGAVYDGLQGAVRPGCALHPTLPYAISKLAAESYVMNAQKRGRVHAASVVRFFGAYGPFEPARKIYGRLVRQFALARSPRFTIRGDGRNLIDAMYVEDAVRAITSILANPGAARTLDLYSGRPLSLEALVREAARAFGLEAEIEFTGEVPEYIEFHSVDATMEEEFGFRPSIELRSGLLRFRDWIVREEAAAAARVPG